MFSCGHVWCICARVCVCVCVCVCAWWGVCVVVGNAFGAVDGGIESKRDLAVEVAVMLWRLLLLLMGHVARLACAAWFADVGVCGVVSPGGWWPGWWECGWTVCGGVCAVWRRMG